MATDNRKNLGEALKVTLGMISNLPGVTVTIRAAHRPEDRGDVYKLHIEPLILCPRCNRLSLAEHCLWCEEEEFDGRGVA